jgi:hypothetical protein
VQLAPASSCQAVEGSRAATSQHRCHPGHDQAAAAAAALAVAVARVAQATNLGASGVQGKALGPAPVVVVALGVQAAGAHQALVVLVGSGVEELALPVRLAVPGAAAAEWGDLEGAAVDLGRWATDTTYLSAISMSARDSWHCVVPGCCSTAAAQHQQLCSDLELETDTKAW